MFALATFSRHLGVYLDPLNLLCLNEAQQKGGITHVQFTPDGSKLLALCESQQVALGLPQTQEAPI